MRAMFCTATTYAFFMVEERSRTRDGYFTGRGCGDQSIMLRASGGFGHDLHIAPDLGRSQLTQYRTCRTGSPATALLSRHR
jgi:hypothetical protein